MTEFEMGATKTRDPKLVTQAATIWAEATAHRDDMQASDTTIDKSIPLIEDVLAASEHSFLLAIADDDDSIVSFAAVEPEREATSPDRGELRFLGVAPEHWGEGWARRLLIALPDASREEGFKDIILWVYADNTRAIWVYEAMGWNATGRTRKHEVTGRLEAEYRIKLT
ncbi:Acetyltransferase (GNAT) family protein [Raineyella antarctica]|uniref:Acetyltransferase (GNAT) family protein n=1 Tax=Raineyella antarctica TaxID=1577474 RepID=A0A1G6H710_9ACTN|nr:GNAT family N-acetyltransferase [Raineyella antarctica]SDB90069.1 Acetyltransferase (GNAT) family protein [Raineyella antarctica]